MNSSILGALKSKTVWFNVISTGLELLNILAVPLGVPPGTITLVTNLGNIALRFVTKEPLSAK